MPWVFWAALAALAIQRLLELQRSRRNEEALRSRGGVRIADEVYGAIVTLHVVWFLAMAAEFTFAPWAGIGWWTPIALVGFLAGQGLRYWSMHTLGERWTTTIVVVPGEAPVERGPYEHSDHPIYWGVGLELLAFPLIFLLPVTALLASVVNVFLLRERIRVESRALAEAAETAPPGTGAEGAEVS